MGSEERVRHVVHYHSMGSVGRSSGVTWALERRGGQYRFQDPRGWFGLGSLVVGKGLFGCEGFLFRLVGEGGQCGLGEV